MSDKRDHKAEFGYEPNWDEQRRKQDELAEEYYERREQKAWEKQRR